MNSPFVSEQQIDSVIEQSSSDEAAQKGLHTLKRDQPVLLSYLFSEHFKAFTKEERAFMLYLTTVIWKAVNKTFETIPAISEEKLGNAEEQNWELLQAGTSKKFRDRLDVFFKDYPQEDLLAFVEDALLDDEESVVSNEGREPIFIALKSIIDCLTGLV